jgi:hypothetical protein
MNVSSLPLFAYRVLAKRKLNKNVNINVVMSLTYDFKIYF